MKKVLFTAVALFLFGSSFAQVENDSIPPNG